MLNRFLQAKTGAPHTPPPPPPNHIHRTHSLHAERHSHQARLMRASLLSTETAPCTSLVTFAVSARVTVRSV